MLVRSDYLQPFADVLKLIMKEDVTPTQGNRMLHTPLRPPGLFRVVYGAYDRRGDSPFGDGLVVDESEC